MSEYTMMHGDVALEDRTWKLGSFAVQRDGVTVALFVFDYPENESKIYRTKADAQAAAKSFMAIDDLVTALYAVLDDCDNLDMCESNGIGRDESAFELVHAALEKAGIK